MTTTDERIAEIERLVMSPGLPFSQIEAEAEWLLAELKALREFVAKQPCPGDVAIRCTPHDPFTKEKDALWGVGCRHCGGAGNALAAFDRQRAKEVK